MVTRLKVTELVNLISGMKHECEPLNLKTQAIDLRQFIYIISLQPELLEHITFPTGQF